MIKLVKQMRVPFHLKCSIRDILFIAVSFQAAQRMYNNPRIIPFCFFAECLRNILICVVSFTIKVYTQVIQDMWDYLSDEKEIERPEDLLGLPIR